MLIGCRAAEHPGPPRTEPRVPLDEAAALGSSLPRDGGAAMLPQDAAPRSLICPPGTVEQCPDPPTCTCGNGTGVYASEGGFAGISVRMDGERFTEQTIMITHFIDNASNVTFEYGYFDTFTYQGNPAGTNQWKSIGIGQVDSADYKGQNNFTVITVRENGTLPTWLLRTPVSGTTQLVSGPDLLQLKLHISFEVPFNGVMSPKTVTLDFNATNTNEVPLPNSNVTQIPRKYNMRWTNPNDYPNNPPQQYCHGPSQQPDDMAVLQQGLDVHPLTGAVTRLNVGNHVTVSCSLGAPAVVYSWGYPYRGSDADTFYFDAGIHMKRASYCGDSRYYTWAGTLIKITDSKLTHNGIPLHPPFSPPGVEAWWGKDGALCVNSENIRHLSLAPKNNELLSCKNGVYSGQPQDLPSCHFMCSGKPLPRCTPNPQQQPFLFDGPMSLNQP